MCSWLGVGGCVIGDLQSRMRNTGASQGLGPAPPLRLRRSGISSDSIVGRILGGQPGSNSSGLRLSSGGFFGSYLL